MGKLEIIFEEAYVPSSSNEIKILQESYDNAEAGIAYPKIKFKAVLLTAGVRNQNGRVYTPEVLQTIVEQLKPKAQAGALLGELDHPFVASESPTVLKRRAVTVELKNAAIKILDLDFDGNQIIGIIETLTTDAGRQVRALIKDGVKIGFSLRALGGVQPDAEGNLIVSNNIKAITFDVVSNPSDTSAFISEIINENSNLGQVIKEFEMIMEGVAPANGDIIMENSGNEIVACFGGACHRGPADEIAEFLLESALAEEKLTKITLKI